jgi:hypothetical protein
VIRSIRRDDRSPIAYAYTLNATIIAELPGMSHEEEQLALARATGNFKRGFRFPA